MNQERPTALDPSAPPRPETTHTAPPRSDRGEGPRRKKRGWIVWLILALIAAGAYYYWSKKTPAGSGTQGGAPGATQKKGGGAIPVVAARATKGQIPVYFTALGQVIPIYTVQIQSRVTGQLMEVRFKEGDLVKKGDPLVEIDPRPYEAALVQAQGQLIRDQALLQNAKVDQARYKTLLAQNAVPEQQVATQDALVTQDEGVVKYDEGLVDAARTNVEYCHIAAPISGRIGLRLIDPGNVVQAPNTYPLLVITQVDPISIIFELPEDQLPAVFQRLTAGQHLKVDAYDRASNVYLASGALAVLDNQIDPTTGTLRLRANFDNKSHKLFANQFVNIRLLVQLKQGVTLVPTATVQRNTQGTYVFLVKSDSTVTVRTINIGTVEGNDSEVTSGLQAGDTVVMTGVDKLTEGTKVSAHIAAATGSGAGTNNGSAPANFPPPSGPPPSPLPGAQPPGTQQKTGGQTGGQTHKAS